MNARLKLSTLSSVMKKKGFTDGVVYRDARHKSTHIYRRSKHTPHVYSTHSLDTSKTTCMNFVRDMLMYILLKHTHGVEIHTACLHTLTLTTDTHKLSLSFTLSHTHMHTNTYTFYIHTHARRLLRVDAPTPPRFPARAATTRPGRG